MFRLIINESVSFNRKLSHYEVVVYNFYRNI